MVIFRLLVVFLFIFQSAFFANEALACTRFVLHGANSELITARSMDWKEDIVTNLWIFYRGVNRNGKAGPNSMNWQSK